MHKNGLAIFCPLSVFGLTTSDGHGHLHTHANKHTVTMQINMCRLSVAAAFCCPVGCCARHRPISDAMETMQRKISRPMTTAHQLQPQSMDLEQFKTISYFCWCTIILCWDGRARIVCMRNGKWLFSESCSAHFPFSLGLYMVRMIDRRRVYFNQAN